MNIEAFMDVSPVVRIHATAAMTALLIGGAIYALPKGRLKHQILGISCAICLAITAITAVFMTGLNGDYWSFIHVFVPLTALGLFGVSMAVARSDWKRHRKEARGLIFGALLIPGLIALIPGRLLFEVAFG